MIRHQVNAFIARTRLAVTYKRNCTHNPPPEIKEAFYRILQETFNNIAKHADATSVGVRLVCLPEKVELLVQGLSNQHIAEKLFVSLSTAKFHVSRILSKLNAGSRTEAVSIALQHHLVKRPD